MGLIMMYHCVKQNFTVKWLSILGGSLIDAHSSSIKMFLLG